MFESLENTSLGAVVLYAALRISDAINKTGIFDKSVRYVTAKLLLFIDKELTNMAVPRRTQILSRKGTSLLYSY